MSNDYGNVAWKDKLSSPGVLEVTIPVKLEKATQSEMRANVAKQVEDTLGFRLPGPFSHVSFIVEKCYEVKGERCGWAGTCDIGLTHYPGQRKQQSLSFHIFCFFSVCLYKPLSERLRRG